MNITIGSQTIGTKFLTSPFSQAIGLMFQKPKPVLMDFKKERRTLGVHMFFCFWKLDIIFLNSKKTVVEMRTLKPFQIMESEKAAHYLLELPAGNIKKYKIKVGTKIKFALKI